MKKMLFLALALFALPKVQAINFSDIIGKNKTPKALEWKVSDVDNIKFHFYSEELARLLLPYLKEAKEELEKKFSFESKETALFLYSTPGEFEDTRMLGKWPLPQGIEGFTLPKPEKRAAIKHDGDISRTAAIARHEMMHAYFHKRKIPRWLEEGIAEYFSRPFDSFENAILKDAWLNKKIRSVKKARYYAAFHSFINFLSKKYGEEKIIEFIKQAKKNAEKATEKVFGKKMNELDEEWQQNLETEYSKYLEKKSKQEKQKQEIEGSNPFVTDKLYFLKNERGLNKIVSLEGKKEKELARDMQHGELEAFYVTNKFIFSTNDGNSSSLYIDGEKIQTPFAHIKNITASEKEIVFSAISQEGKQDLFSLDEKKMIKQLTNNFDCEDWPTITEEGIIFSKKIVGSNNYDLYLLNEKETQLTSTKENEIMPFFDEKEKKIYFSCDLDGIYNIYAANAEKIEKIKKVTMLTDVPTAAFSPFVKDNMLYFVLLDNGYKICKTPISKLKDINIEEKIELGKEKLEGEKLEEKLKAREYEWKKSLKGEIKVFGSILRKPYIIFFSNINDILKEKNFNLFYEKTKYSNFYLGFSSAKGSKEKEIILSKEKIKGGKNFEEKAIKLRIPEAKNRYENKEATLGIGIIRPIERAEATFTRYFGFSDYNLFEGITPLQAEEKSFFVFFRKKEGKDKTAWKIPFGPDSGFSEKKTFEIALTKNGINALAELDIRKYKPLDNNKTYAFRLNIGTTIGREARKFYLGGISLRGYSIFDPIETKNKILISNELRIPLKGELKKNLGVVFVDSLLSEKVIGSVGAGIRIPLDIVTLKIDYAKRTDFRNFLQDMKKEGVFYFWIGHDF